MDSVAVICAVAEAAAGIGVFLIACVSLSADLCAAFEKKSVALFRGGKSRLACAASGAAVTAVIQSSSAVTVPIIGLVDAGALPLGSAAAAIFGANVGTTVTSLLVALGFLGDGLPATALPSALTFAGALVFLSAKSERGRRRGRIIAAFGLLYVGLSIMSGAMSGFAELDSLARKVALFDDPLFLVLAGTAITAVVQSSSATVSLAVTMIASGMLALDQGIFFTVGANIGTCATAFIAACAGTKNAARVAAIHLAFNLFGTGIFAVTETLLRVFGTGCAAIVGGMAPDSPETALALFHLLFNLATALVALPLANGFARLALRLVPERSKKRRKA